MLGKLLSIIWEWRFIFLLSVGTVLYCLLEWQKAKAIIYAGIAQAKRYAKDQILKSGKQQEDYVVKLALQFLPLAWKLLIGEDNIRKLIRWLYKKLGDYMDDGILNDTYELE